MGLKCDSLVEYTYLSFDFDFIILFNFRGQKIEDICLDMSKVKEIRLNTSTFTKMPKLRFLKFYSSSFNGENKCKISYLQDPGFA